MLLICISLIISDVEYLLIACWSSAFPLWKSVCLIFLPIFKLGCLLFDVEVYKLFIYVR